MASDNKNRLAERIAKMQQEQSQNNDGGNKTSPSTSQTTTNTQGRLAQRINTMRSSTDKSSTVDDDFITVYLSDASKYLNQAKSKYEGIGYSNASDTWQENIKASNNLIARGNSIRDYLLKNKSSIDEKAYESLMKQIISIKDALGGYTSALTDARQYYSQWKTEDEYNTWQKKESFISEYLKDPEKATSSFEYDEAWLREADYRKKESFIQAYIDDPEKAKNTLSFDDSWLEEAERRAEPFLRF